MNRAALALGAAGQIGPREKTEITNFFNGLLGVYTQLPKDAS
jgi:hypothetical protein